MSLGHGKDLSPAEAAEYKQLKENPPVIPVQFAAICPGCGGGMPYGYVGVATKWETKSWGPSYHVQVPVEMKCRECGKGQVVTRDRSKGPKTAGSTEKIHAALKSMPDSTPATIAINLAERAETMGIDTSEFRKKHNIMKEEKAVDIKAIAIAVYSKMSDTPRSSTALCKLAGLDLELQPMVKKILVKLASAGKVVFVEGRWIRK